MSASEKTMISPPPGSVVGTIPSPEALRMALALPPGAVDFFELRVDHFAADLVPIMAAVPQLAAPLIVTVRHPAEGGANRLLPAQRRDLFAKCLPYAKIIDVELRSVRPMRGVIAEARSQGVPWIASAHFFENMPSPAKLNLLANRALQAGASIFKIATLTRTMSEVLSLLRFLLSHQSRLPLSVMGMGACGRISRLLLARAGSVLNYGYLDTVQVPGQWPATLLKERLSEI